MQILTLATVVHDNRGIFHWYLLLILSIFAFDLNIQSYLLSLITVVSQSIQLPVVGTGVCLYSDGTKVTEKYFHTLPDNTELVLLPKGQTWSVGGKTNLALSHKLRQALNI